MSKYRLYPTPRSIVYDGGVVGLPKQLRLISNVELTDGLLSRFQEVLSKKNLSIDDTADFILELQIDEQLNHSVRTSYDLSIHAGGILIRAVNKEALFYGLTTLYHIFDQASDHLQTLEIHDHASLQFRGLIEGYYGIPWSDASRKSILTFGSYFKMNIYAFAPKDDPYHRDLWWELYPEKELAVISSLALHGAKLYNQYAWTIAPFKADANPIREDNKEEGLALLKRKFDQLYDVGVRQFGVLGDDVGNLPYETVVFIMNNLNHWRKEKGDVEELIFCPEGYNMDDWAFKDGSELNIYDKEFDQDIHIFFTGMSTCSPVTKEAIQAFKTRATRGQDRRDPLFWMNWPVNDIDRTTYRRLFMGKGELYEPGVTDMTGVLTNPMEEAEASKVALFASLDYAWNVMDFDADTSWADSFTYIEPDASLALHELSKHMSEVSNGAKPDAEESSELEALIHAFNLAKDKGSYEDELAALIAAYKKITDCADEFNQKSQNEQLKKEMKAYIANLKDKANAAVAYLTLLYRDEADKNALQQEAQTYMHSAISHKVLTRTAEFPSTELTAQTGAKVIDKHLKALQEQAR